MTLETAAMEHAARHWHVALPRRAQKITTADVQGKGINARIARRVTAAVGTMYAFYLFACVMGGWIIWQTALSNRPFDPYPFAFLLFLGNIVQLLLMPLIMVGQNVQSAHADARAEADFEVDRKAEAEIEKLLEGIRQIDERTLRIVERLEREYGLTQPPTAELGEAATTAAGSGSVAAAGPIAGTTR